MKAIRSLSLAVAFSLFSSLGALGADVSYKTITCERNAGTFDAQQAVLHLAVTSNGLVQGNQVSTLRLRSAFGEETIAVACSQTLDLGEGALYPERNYNRCLGGSAWGTKAVNELQLHYGVKTGYYAELRQNDYVQTPNRVVSLACKE